MGEARAQALLQAVAQRGKSLLIGLAVSKTKFERFGKTNNARHIQSARAHAALMTTAVHDGSNAHTWVASAYVQHADAFRAIDFVR